MFFAVPRQVLVDEVVVRLAVRIREQCRARAAVGVEPVARLADLGVGVGPRVDAAERALALLALDGPRERVVVVVPAVALYRERAARRGLRPPGVAPPAAADHARAVELDPCLGRHDDETCRMQ